jgi:hypothetical protein
VNRKITFTVGPSVGQDDSQPILNPRLMPRGDDWVVAYELADNVVGIGRVISVPDPPSLEAQITALNNLHKQALTELEAIAHALAGMRAGIIDGAGTAELTPIVDGIINDVFDLHAVLS